MMRASEVLGGRSWTVRGEIRESVCLLILNCVVPMLLNVGYEARQRSRFSEKDDIAGIQPAWAWILAVQQRVTVGGQ